MTPRHEVSRPHKRNGYWYLIRRVPAEFAAFDARDRVVISTGIRIPDDPRGIAARSAVEGLDAGLERYWKEKRAGRDANAGVRYERCVQAARKSGLPYLPTSEIAELPIAELPIAELVSRVERLENGVVEKADTVSAILGGEDRPAVMVSEMADEFERIIAASLVGKSQRQKKKWRAPKDRAVGVFLVVLGGDRPISELTRSDVLALRQHWQDRIIKGEVEIHTGNKCIGHIAGMFRTINETNQLGLGAIFDNAGIAGEKEKQRVAFAASFVQEKILAEGMFDDLNAEARALIYLLAETGLRPSEACNLGKGTILLDHGVPHVQVRPDDRQMKTDQSMRDKRIIVGPHTDKERRLEKLQRYLDISNLKIDVSCSETPLV